MEKMGEYWRRAEEHGDIVWTSTSGCETTETSLGSPSRSGHGRDPEEGDVDVVEGPPIRLTLFGPLALTVEGEPVRGLRSRKAVLLLALTATDDTMTRDEAAALLWPDLERTHRRAEFSRVVYDLHRRLGPVLGRRGGPLRLDPHLLGHDLLDLAAAEASDDPECWRAALTRFRDPFLQDVPAGGPLRDWADDHRRRQDARLAALTRRGVQHDLLDDLATVAAPSRLPVPLGPLFGREDLVREVLDAVASPGPALITLVGEGGIGKTRVALDVAQSARSDAAFDTVGFVALNAVRHADFVIESVCRALGTTGGSRPWEAVRARVEGRRVLLVLDNVEQIDDMWTWIRRTLDSFPTLCLLATARRPVGLVGEQLIPVRELDPSTAATLLGYQLRKSGVPERDRPDDARLRALCDHLDGLPLAIELAAVAAGRVGWAGLVDRVLEEITVNPAGERDRPERHRTLRAAVHWSYRLTPPASRRVFADLATFGGAADVDAIAAVSGRSPRTTRMALEDLVAIGLVRRRSTGVQAQPYYGLRQSVIPVAEELLDRGGRAALVEARHTAHFLARAEATRRGGRDASGRNQLDRVEALDGDIHEIRLAMQRAAGRGTVEIAAWCRALSLYWKVRHHDHEARRWLDWTLARRADLPTSTTAALLIDAVFVDDKLGDRSAAVRHAGELAALAVTSADPEIHLWVRAHAAGRALFDGDATRARNAAESVAQDAQAAEHREVGVTMLATLMYAEILTGDLRAAARAADRGLAACDEAADMIWRPVLLGGLARVRLVEGDPAGSARHLMSALELTVRVGDAFHESPVFLEVAGCLTALGQFEAAARTLGTLAHIQRQAGIVTMVTDIDPDALAGRIREAIGGTDFETQFAAGERLTAAVAAEQLRVVLSP